MATAFLEESKTIRELNRMSLVLMQGNTSLEYAAYMNGGISFNITSNMEDMTNLSPNAMTTMFANLAGFAPAFDMPRWFSYKGTRPISFSLDTYLKLETNMGKDIINPFMNLCKMVLPTTTEESISGMAKKIPVVGELLSAIGLIDSDNLVATRLNEVKLFKLPLSINPKEANSDATRMKLRMGKYGENAEDASYSIKVGVVVVTSIDVSWGRLMVNVGYPERVDIRLTLETMRSASANMLSSLFYKEAK